MNFRSCFYGKKYVKKYGKKYEKEKKTLKKYEQNAINK
jgi:hypothetical protein